MDLHFLLREFKALESGKVEKIFQDPEDKKSWLFRFHVPGKGRMMLRILLPGLIYLSEYKPAWPNPAGYCMFLRKYLGNSRLKSIDQHGFERILILEFEARKEGKPIKYLLVLELFSKGNMILCDQDMRIRSPLENQNWSDRTVRGGIKYKYPPEQADALSLDEAGFMDLLGKSKRHSIVKALAIDLGLGGLYAEELCAMAKMDKEKVPASVDMKRLFAEWIRMRDIGIRACICSDHVLAFPFITLKEDCVFHDSFSQALDEKHSSKIVSDGNSEQVKKHEKILNSQEQKIIGFKKSAEENQKKGELIYENYALLKSLLDELREIRKKHSWQDIRKRLKGHKLIKDVNEKEGKVVVELK